MNTETNLPLYVGITDFTAAHQVRELLQLIPVNHRRSLMVGVMMSFKTFHGIHSKWSDIWPKPYEVKDIFIDNPRALNTLHWADYNEMTSGLDLMDACMLCGPNLKAIQLDMIWPKSHELGFRDLKLAGYQIIVQIGSNALNMVDNDPVRVLRHLDCYGEKIDCVLLDKSMGRGLGMDSNMLRPFVKAITDEFPHLGIAVAGGLGPNSLHLVQSLMEEFPNLSIDAQGQLRPSGSALDPIDWAMAGEFFSRSLKLFP